MDSAPASRFLAELYVPSTDVARVPAPARAVTVAAGADGRVRVMEAISLPDDETCFLVLEAADERAVAAVLARAGLAVNRISPAIIEH